MIRDYKVDRTMESGQWTLSLSFMVKNTLLFRVASEKRTAKQSAIKVKYSLNMLNRSQMTLLGANHVDTSEWMYWIGFYHSQCPSDRTGSSVCVILVHAILFDATLRDDDEEGEAEERVL